jgi:hypothetical protein
MSEPTLIERLRDAAGWVDHQMDPAPDWDGLLTEAAEALEAATPGEATEWPLWYGFTWQFPDYADAPHSFISPGSLPVPKDSKVEVWPAGLVTSLRARIEAAQHTLADWEDDDLDDYIPPASMRKPLDPPKMECPLCGETKRLNINMVDISDGPYLEQIPGTIECLNPTCPSAAGRYVHRTPGTSGRVPCCGLVIAEVPGARSWSSNPGDVTCPGPAPTEP